MGVIMSQNEVQSVAFHTCKFYISDNYVAPFRNRSALKVTGIENGSQLSHFWTPL